MSLQSRLASYITRVGTEFKAIRTLISGTGTGDVSNLNTTATDLVSAINEVLAGATGASINDGATNATETWSSIKIDAEISAAINALLDGAPGALDTLNELAAAVNDDASFAASVTASLALKANSADVYTQAELGDPETDLVALFNAALL